MGILEGRIIREKRKAMGYTQQQLANEIGISHYPIHQLENGEESISLKNLRLITDKIGMEVSILDKDAKATTDN